MHHSWLLSMASDTLLWRPASPAAAGVVPLLREEV